jgi:hypothetical protein
VSTQHVVNRRETESDPMKAHQLVAQVHADESKSAAAVGRL